MKISINKDQTKLELKLEGRLDTGTAPQLERALADNLEGIDCLEMDFNDLEYLSSAGLRVLLATSKRMKEQGKMVIRNVNSEVMEVFTITGFRDILTIE